MESIQPAKIPLLAIPTTAGTGSESTHFAVVYVKGKKQSVAHEALLPDRVLLDASALKGLPEYQKKCTLMDAMCQAIESWWNVNRTEESVTYAKEALQRSLANRQAYLQGEEVAAHEMLRAANLAGRAINITKTTAPHAMSYKLTSLYGLSHGHAVALCLPEVWRHMIAHWDQCVDTKGGVFVQQVCDEIAHALGQPTQEAAIHWLESLITEMGLEKPKPKQLSVELKLLAASVDPVRLGNHPVRITQDEFYHMYEHILHTEA